MNKNLLERDVQTYISKNLNADVSRISLSKSPFAGVSAAELANQIAAKKKSEKKLPTWYKQDGVMFPTTLSIEQTSSEETAIYKQNLLKGTSLIDITAGFGVDSFYFAKRLKEVYSCEINEALSATSAHNAKLLGVNNINFLATDGLAFLSNTKSNFDVIYVDPARRGTSGKVFKLAECEPNVVAHLDLMFEKSPRIIVKTSPLLDIQAGLVELRNVSEIHIVSVKNECKELLWVLDRDFNGETQLFCVTLNDEVKTLSFGLSELKAKTTLAQTLPNGYLYEPDVAVMKSGAFELIAEKFDLQKLAAQSHLYFSNRVTKEFPGRIFEIKALLKPNELKRNALAGNVIVRNFPEKAENLVKKYKIAPSKNDFLIFTNTLNGNMLIKAEIVQYY
jgi:16S rRNA G966 N2-methylase RsmD